MDVDFLDPTIRQTRWWLGTWNNPGENDDPTALALRSNTKIAYLTGQKEFGHGGVLFRFLLYLKRDQRLSYMKEIHPAIIWVPVGDVLKTYKSVHQEPSRLAEFPDVGEKPRSLGNQNRSNQRPKLKSKLLKTEKRHLKLKASKNDDVISLKEKLAHQKTMQIAREEPNSRSLMIEEEKEERIEMTFTPKIKRENTSIGEELLSLKQQLHELKEKQALMNKVQNEMLEKQEGMVDAFKFLMQHQLNLYSVLKMPPIQRDMIVQEINFANAIPSPTVADLKQKLRSQDVLWLKNELFLENLVCLDSAEDRKSNDVTQLRYASESVVDINNKLELLKHEDSKWKYSSSTKQFTFKIERLQKIINLRVLSNLQAHLVPNTCMKLIQKEQQILEDCVDRSSWFYCPILDSFHEGDSGNTNYDHFYVYLLNLRPLLPFTEKSKPRGFQLRTCSLDSLRPGNISQCMLKFEIQFKNQVGWLNEVKPISNINFGENTKQIKPFDCSHYVTSHLEYLLGADENIWSSLDGGEEPVAWEGIQVPGGYYASKLIRLITLLERKSKNLECEGHSGNK